MTEDYSFRPTTAPRPNSLYVSWRLYKALRLVARKTGKTCEDLVEAIMSSYVREHHAEIETWMAAREKEERDFMAKLKPTNSEGINRILQNLEEIQ